MIAATSLGTAAISEETNENTSIWLRLKSGTVEGAATIFEATKDGATASASYVGDKFVIARDVTAEWTSDQYDEFRSNHPEIASNIDDFTGYVGETGGMVFEKGKDGIAVAYEVTSNGTKTSIEWSRDRIDQLPVINACTIANYDLLGGIAIGTFGTAMSAGTSTLAVVEISTAYIATSSGLIPIAASSVAGVVSVPAIATGVAVAAAAGATVYVTAKGVCYLTTDEEATDSLD